MSRWRRAVAPVGIALVLAPLGGCGSPGDLAAYREEASTSVAGATSNLATVELTLRTWRQGKSPDAATTVLLGDADKALSGVIDGFASLDPPTPAADAVRARVLPVLDAAQDSAAAARIAVSRGDAAAADRAVTRMDKALDDLESTAVTLR